MIEYKTRQMREATNRRKGETNTREDAETDAGEVAND